MNFQHALVRRPGPNLVDGQSMATLGRVDYARALDQHAAYCAALRALGLTVMELEPDLAHPDATFVEDTAVIHHSAAFLTRPGHPSRITEVDGIAPAVERQFADCTRMTGPGTLDGGDVLETDGVFVIGLSARTDAAGAAELSAWLAARGRQAVTVDITGVPGLLHLKTGISWLGDGRVAVIREFADHPALAGWQRVVVDEAEAYAANCLRIGDSVVLPAGHPRFAAEVAALGLRVVALEMSEFQKVDGGLSCLSLRW
jgi:dimethylargininase